MTIAPAPPIEQRLLGMAAAIRRLIPAAEVRLFGSRARGKAGPDSDIDLLITAPDAGWPGATALHCSLTYGARWPSPISRSIWCSTPAARPPAGRSRPEPSYRKPCARGGGCSMSEYTSPTLGPQGARVVSREAIEALAQRLVEKSGPENVILFGSEGRVMPAGIRIRTSWWSCPMRGGRLPRPAKLAGPANPIFALICCYGGRKTSNLVTAGVI